MVRSLATSLERCATEYAEYWFTKESPIVAALSGNDQGLRLSALQRAAGYYRIARNLPRACDVGRGLERLAPVLTLLDGKSCQHVSATNLSEVVQVLRHQIGGAYGGRNLLSAATKFLWLMHRDVVVIFDSQVRAALETPDADYDTYLHRWRDGYASLGDDIHLACRAISSNRGSLLRSSAVSDRDLSVVVAQEWFKRRVYDIYLWQRGALRRPREEHVSWHLPMVRN